MATKQEEREEFSKAQKILTEEMKRGEFRPLYLFYGEEAYLLSYYKNIFVRAFSENEGINIHRVGEDLETKNLKDIAETLPFFAPYRLMLFDGKVLHDFPFPSLLLSQISGLPVTSLGKCLYSLT